MTALLEFECRRSPDGYRVLAADQRKLCALTYEDNYSVPPPADATDDERYLLERWGMHVVPNYEPEEVAGIVVHYIEPRSKKIERFNLFESAPALFLEFSHTPTTFKGVKAFADRYGLLGDGNLPETVKSWFWSIRRMKRAVVSWKNAQNTGNFKKVVRLIEGLGQARLVSGAEDRGILANLLLKVDEPSGKPRICIRPSDLQDALWVQFALAVDGSRNFRSCVECRSWFQVEAGGSRPDKKYCSVACRMRAYRRRTKKDV